MTPWGVAMVTGLCYVLVPTVDSVELQSTLMTCSLKCQYTAKNCLLQSRTASAEVNARQYCRLFQMNTNGLTAYHCLVRLGLCTDREYDKLKVAACGGTIQIQDKDSDAKTFFYSVIDAIRKFCQKELLICIKASSVATVYKQHEQFCFLMGLSLDQFNFRTCLLQNNQCIHSDYATLKDSACKELVKEVGASKFFNALLLTSPSCRNGLDLCSISSMKALELIQSEQYCEALHVEEDGKSAYMCLVQSDRCVVSEYDRLKDAVCSGNGGLVLTLDTMISSLLVYLIHSRLHSK